MEQESGKTDRIAMQRKFFFGICDTVIVIFAPCGQRHFVQNSHADRMKGREQLSGRLSTGEILSCQISRDLWMHQGKKKTH